MPVVMEIGAVTVNRTVFTAVRTVVPMNRTKGVAKLPPTPTPSVASNPTAFARLCSSTNSSPSVAHIVSRAFAAASILLINARSAASITSSNALDCFVSASLARALTPPPPLPRVPHP